METMNYGKTIELFYLFELLKEQARSGFLLSDFRKEELDSLAAHQYLVTIMAWHFGKLMKDAGSKIDFSRAGEICLIHDLGEIFGGDSSYLLGLINPGMRKLAKGYEAGSQEIISVFFGNQKDYVLELFQEEKEEKTDESKFAKVMDYLEAIIYKRYLKKNTFMDKEAEKKLLKIVKTIKDKIAKEILREFFIQWMQYGFDGLLKILASYPLSKNKN